MSGPNPLDPGRAGTISGNSRMAAAVYLDTGVVFDEQTRARAADLMARYPDPRSALLPLLHLVQSVEGFVSRPGLVFCAEQLGLELSDVSGVATFYTMFKRRPCGEHLVSVCTNTLCALLGGDEIFERLSEHLGVGHEGTSGEPGAPGSITLEHAECLAACDHGPVVTVNYEYFDNQTGDSALDLVRRLQNGERPDPTRGAPLTSLRDVELQIAGFFEGRDADVDAPSASPETLRGARMAADHGWTAPAMPENVELPAAPQPGRK